MKVAIKITEMVLLAIMAVVLFSFVSDIIIPAIR